jgi:Ser/Thr protein kinase RdoA (MazF antagonist)
LTAGLPDSHVQRANTVLARAASTVDPAGRLTERLMHLSDTVMMRTLLQQALDDLRPQAFTVEGYAVDHCKVTPWREISLALSLMLRSTRTGEWSRQIVAGTMFATVDEARRHLQGARPACETEAAALALVPEMAMVVQPFPLDAGLPGLAHASDTAAMTALLAAHLPECRDQGWRIRDLACEPLQYKPGRLCTLRYTLALDRRGTLDAHRIEVFGKVYRDDRWRQSYALLEATWQASVASAGRWTAARPIAAVDSWRLIVQRAVRGRQFRHVLGDLTTDGACPDDLRDAETHLTAVAQAVRSLQQAPIALGSRLDFRTLLGAQRDNLSYLHQVHPALARELEQVRATVERLAAASPAAAVGFAHGDFAHGNVLLDRGHVGIIDFDRAGQAEAAYDVAYFLTHLASFALRHPERAARVRSLCEHFRETFCALAGVSPQRLAVYEALDLSAYVLRNFRKRSHQAEWIGWASGQIAAAWDRLETAS